MCVRACVRVCVHVRACVCMKVCVCDRPPPGIVFISFSSFVCFCFVFLLFKSSKAIFFYLFPFITLCISHTRTHLHAHTHNFYPATLFFSPSLSLLHARASSCSSTHVKFLFYLFPTKHIIIIFRADIHKTL
jgi:hypothetical protein